MDTRYIIGIDLGTTNSVLASLDTAETEDDQVNIEVQEVPQLTNPSEVESASSLPSFLYVPSELDFPVGSLALPWDDEPSLVVGQLARTRGAENPSRLIASAKSWLSHAAVNRTASILPWDAPDEVPKLSPVDASSRYLEHLRSAWDGESDPELIPVPVHAADGSIEVTDATGIVFVLLPGLDYLPPFLLRPDHVMTVA